MARVAVLASAIAGCAYQPGTFAVHDVAFHGTHVTLGCVDLSVARDDRSSATGTVVEYTFGNRCEHRVGFDLASVRAIGHTADGVAITFAPYDPDREIRPLPLVAVGLGVECIEYRGAVQLEITSLCLDVGGVDQSISRTENWVCL